MNRPPIEGYKKHIKDHCGLDGKARTWCEDWGCEQAKELIDYIEFLENKISKLLHLLNLSKLVKGCLPDNIDLYYTCPNCRVCVKGHVCDDCGYKEND